MEFRAAWHFGAKWEKTLRNPDRGSTWFFLKISFLAILLLFFYC